MTQDSNRPDEDARSNDRTNGFSFTRRGMLGAGAAGFGLAGASSAAGAQEGDGGSENAPFAAEDHDHSGDYLGEQEPVDRLDVRKIGGSRREGDIVYYDPDEPGPYVDGQDALEDVPYGGTLQLGHGVWDVATEGRLVREDPINIRGVGGARDRTDNATPKGTVILNTGNDAVDEPVIELRNSADDGEQRERTSIRDLYVGHEGPSTPAILIDDFIRTFIGDCTIRCGNIAPTGIKYKNWGFFARTARSHVGGFTDYGIQVTGVGYGHEFYSNHVSTGSPGAVALETQCHRTIIMGGQYSAVGEEGTAIRFYNPHGHPRSGGVVIEPGIEVTPLQIDIDGVGPFQNVQIYHMLMRLQAHGENTGVRFGNARNCKLLNPVIHGQPGEIAQWSTDAVNCGIISDADTLRGCTYTDEGADNPYVHINAAAPDEYLAEIPTGVPTKVGYGVDPNSPMFHDGESWYDMPSDPYALNPSNDGDEGDDEDGGENGDDDVYRGEPETVHYEIAQQTITPDGDVETSGLSTWNVEEDGTLTELSDGDTAGTIGGNIWLSWDADSLYFQAAIDDQLHHQPYQPGELWRGDSIQVAVAPGSGEWEEFQEYTLARNDDGTQVHGVITGATDSRSAGVRDFDAQIVRDDDNEQTRYEVAIPWTELDSLGGFDPASDEYLGVDWAVLDADGESEDNIDRYVPWHATGASAITAGKDPAMLKAAQLID